MRLISLGIAGFAAVFALQACATVDTLYLSGARMSGPTGVEELAKTSPVEALLLSHRVSAGHQVVLLWRRFDPGGICTIDDEKFEQLTLEIPAIEPGMKIDLGKEGSRVFYSVGSASFVRKGYGRYSIEAEGFLSIERFDKGSVTATIDARFLTVSASPLGGDRELLRKVGRFTFRRISLSSLTPWLGKETQMLEGAAYR